MTDMITLTGVVATEPQHSIVKGGTLPITKFRLVSTERKFDRTKNQWVDGHTNWYTISTFRQLALNVATSLRKGERVVVTGKLRLNDWERDGKSGLNVDVDADAVGHDMTLGTSTWVRVLRSSNAPAHPEDDSADESEEQGSDPGSVQAATSWPTTAPPDADEEPQSSVRDGATEHISRNDTVAAPF